jgi:hypothetical protein
VEAQVPIPTQITNGDEQIYPHFIGNYSKGLPHNTIGEVDPSAYRSLLNAVRQGAAAAFEQVPLGGNTLLVNPLAGVAFDLEGTDSHQLAIPPIPSVASQGLADQAVELYWMTLCRDINFWITEPIRWRWLRRRNYRNWGPSRDRNSTAASPRRLCSAGLRQAM